MSNVLIHDNWASVQSDCAVRLYAENGPTISGVFVYDNRMSHNFTGMYARGNGITDSGDHHNYFSGNTHHRIIEASALGFTAR